MGSVGREERFVAFDIHPSQATVLPVKFVPWPSNDVILNKNFTIPNVKQFLGDCQGELLMVFVCLDGSNRVSKCFVYRMDFSKWEWMQVKSLGEESLFVSLRFRRVPVISFSGMTGRGNCIYIGGYKNNMWSEYCLDDGRHTDHAVCLDYGCRMVVEEQCCLYNGMVSWVSLSQCFS
ncbi:hypothetical protein QJS04_geneDACA007314 [Acorus gramineus]|uniref:KIB1-4 beta-propeller domain-containing protein n=1 Tax=Acorus gramineus TaxID=55184 RepID=A0AAV9BP45_ACOGR|nr:hypothetical protein QJS04_geneDACA007314 [Acorus gramineus]